MSGKFSSRCFIPPKILYNIKESPPRYAVSWCSPRYSTTMELSCYNTVVLVHEVAFPKTATAVITNSLQYFHSGWGTNWDCSSFGQWLRYDDNDHLAVLQNIHLVHKQWHQILKVLTLEASCWVLGCFYMAAIQAVLLYGSENGT